MGRALIPAMKRSTAPRRPPNVPGHILLGCLPAYNRGPLEFFSNAAEQFGDIVRIRFGPTTTLFVNHPDGIKHVLQENHRNYRRNEFSNNIVKLFVGESLLTTDGEFWLRQRRLMQPAFHKQRIAAFGDLMTDTTLAMFDRWQRLGGRGQPLDIADEMMRLTLAIAGKALFSVNLDAEASAIGEAITEGQAYFNYRSRTLFPVPLFLPVARNRRFQAAKRLLDQVVEGMIAERRSTNEQYDDLLAMLMEARDEETGERMSDEQVRNEVVTMLIAGHETTANALSWTFYLLSEHPAVERALHDELAAVLGGRTPTVEDLPALRYTRMVIEEAMRLYPPAWIIGRQSIEQDEICGYPVPAGTGVFVSPYTIHRHPAFWDEPDRFRPERFAPEQAAGRPRFAYMPFGGGPHLCIGNMFALTEAQLVLATIAQRYYLKLVPGYPVEPEPLITLRPRYGLRMTLRPRTMPARPVATDPGRINQA